MNKNKIYLLLTLLLLIPNKYYADKNYKTKDVTYNNYYFFDESETVCTPPNCSGSPIKKTLGGSTNYTFFYKVVAGANQYGNETIIPLSRDCKNENDDCWNFKKFYSMQAANYNGDHKEYDLGEASNGIEKGTMCHTYYTTSENGDTINKYYSHGCYMNATEEKWNTDDNEYSYSDFEPSILACSAVPISPVIHMDRNNGYLSAKITRPEFDKENIQTKLINSNSNMNSCPDGIYPINYNGNYIINEPALYKYKYTVPENECITKVSKNENGCNNTTTISNKCDKETVRSDDYYANISLNQTGYVTNLLSPDKIYSGGGVKFGFVYYNTVNWEILDTPIGDLSTIKNVIDKKFKNNEEIENDISVSIDIKDKNEDLIQNFANGDVLKECSITRSDKGSSGTITTICEFSLPESKISDYTGEVQYISTGKPNINNMYYTPIDYNYNDLHFTARLENLSVIKEDWVGDWNLNYDFSANSDDSCKVDVYNGLNYEYRPIDLNKPFPNVGLNRHVGFNWVDWWNKHKDDKEYFSNKLEYTATLDNKKIAEIKEYNNKHGYLSWDINDKNSFIKNKNIFQEGDG